MNQSALPSQKKLMVLEWRPFKKGASLQGFATLQLPSGLVLHDVTFHRREDGATWVGMPARSYIKRDGETSWMPMVGFIDKAAERRFRDLAIEAIEAFLAAQQPQRNSSSAVLQKR
jgi:hypothetical protein